jgi:uncharacterized protein YkwD
MRMGSRVSTVAAALAVSVVLAMLPTAANAVPAFTPPPDRSHPHHHHRQQPNYSWQLFQATNASRDKKGLPALRMNREISALVVRHCEAMARSHKLFHTVHVSRYLSHVGRWRTWGENIGWTGGGIAGLQRAFMASYEHRANILSHAFRHVAVGAIRIGHKLWVTVFFYG